MYSRRALISGPLEFLGLDILLFGLRGIRVFLGC